MVKDRLIFPSYFTKEMCDDVCRTMEKDDYISRREIVKIIFKHMPKCIVGIDEMQTGVALGLYEIYKACRDAEGVNHES